MRRFYVCFAGLVSVLIATSVLIGARATAADQDDRQVIDYLAPDGSGARESIRLWRVVAGDDYYYALFIDGTRWMLTDAGAISCDEPEASAGWGPLSLRRRADMRQACGWEWERDAPVEPLPDPEAFGPRSWGDYKHYRSLMRIPCDALEGPLWESIRADHQRDIRAYCDEPERVWTTNSH